MARRITEHESLEWVDQCASGNATRANDSETRELRAATEARMQYERAMRASRQSKRLISEMLRGPATRPAGLFGRLFG